MGSFIRAILVLAVLVALKMHWSHTTTLTTTAFAFLLKACILLAIINLGVQFVTGLGGLMPARRDI